MRSRSFMSAWVVHVPSGDLDEMLIADADWSSCILIRGDPRLESSRNMMFWKLTSSSEYSVGP